MSLGSKQYCKFPRNKEAARVAVAKDVIKHLQAGLLRPKQNFYVNFGNRLRTLSKKPARLEEVGPRCYVCAMGALLLSAFERFDGKAFSVMADDTSDNLAEYEVLRQLIGLFSKEQLKLIEAAFERRVINPQSPFHGHDQGAAIAFGKQHRSAHDRLLAIMQNVIDHGGTFKPEVQYVVS